MAKSLKNMMGAGIGAGTATLINGTVADALVATGSVQTDALVLTNDVNVVGFVSAGTGVRLLANPQPSDEVLISNLGLNALLVYPPIGATISGGSVNSPLSLPAGATAEFVARTGSANWVSLSSGVTVVAPAGLATPTLTNSSSLGAIPVVLSWSDTDYTAGLYGQLEIDQTSNAFANITQNIVFFVDGASWATLDEAIGLQSPAGTYFSRIRACRENESGATTVTGTDPIGNAVSFLADVSSWSNTFTDTTIPSLTFAWNPANKSTWDSTHQTLSNSNRTWLVTTAAAGANSAIRSTLNITGNGTKVYFEFNIDTWDLGGSGGSIGLATDTYGGSGTPGSLASVGDALANLSQTGWLQDAGADLYVANSFVATPAGIDLLNGHAIGFAVRVNASDTTLWVLDNGVCGHGDPVAGTGGYTLPFTQLRPVAALNPNNGTNQGVTINTQATAATRAPSGYTAAGAP